MSFKPNHLPVGERLCERLRHTFDSVTGVLLVCYWQDRLFLPIQSLSIQEI